MIGRKFEIEILDNVLKAQAAQFVAVTGRRRVGKTFLIRSFFEKKINIMEVVGRKSAAKKDSLKLFIDALNNSFKISVRIPYTTSWKVAFQSLTEALEAANGPYLLFLDELPWLASKDQELLNELEHFWNARWSQIKNFKLIVCGSATSWIIDNIINNKSGLHNRLTAMIHLRPFSLKEVEEYLIDKKIALSREEIINLYICIGGIPYYLDWIKPNKSVPQIIQELCFISNGRLASEYDSLLESLFIRSNKHKTILKALSKKQYGLTGKEISEITKISLGGTLVKLLEELEACHFINKYYPYGSKQRNGYYRLTDEFVMFHYKWIEPAHKKGITVEKDYWLKRFNSPEFLSWAGYNFETICHNHINQILFALGITGIKTEISHWNCAVDKSLGLNKDRYQIDLVIDRADRAINLCEVKYSSNTLIIDKKLITEIQEREAAFKKVTKTNKKLISTIISSAKIVGSKNPNFSGLLIYGEQLFSE